MTHRNDLGRLAALLVLTALGAPILGCDSKESTEPVRVGSAAGGGGPVAAAEPMADAPGDTPDQPAAKPKKETGPLVSAKIKFKDSAGKTAFSIKPKDDGAKVVDGAEKELFRIKRKGTEIKVRDGADKTLVVARLTDKGYKLKNGDESTELCNLKADGAGGYKLVDAADKLLCRIKTRDYGWELHDAADKSLCKVKTKGDKKLIQDASDQTTLSTKHAIKARALIGLALPDRPLEQRVALALALENF